MRQGGASHFERDGHMRRVLHTAFVMRGMEKFPKVTVRKLCSTGERVAAAIFGDVGFEACVSTWFWRVEAARSVESTD
ncbi:hypothetical protein Taro_045925 [Colocasia esculenta]|uniref:Uncharacterized protein n=1 Tax=Colocasia esculenta TaxID=4460 RepID=A0A843WNF3_COLES|nr:hypothetical protein [Colocasia esculenta]